MVDTGCRSALGGTSFHQARQHTMDGLSWPCSKVRHVAYYPFGHGEPLHSESSWNIETGKNCIWQNPGVLSKSSRSR